MILVLFLGAAQLVPLAANQPVNDRTSGLAGELETILREEKLTGVAWVKADRDGNITTGATGLRDKPGNLAFNTDTRFHVGSVTKSVLATGVLRMVSQGLIELDAPLRRYLPELGFENDWAPADPVTIRHLLDHTTGFDDARLWQMFSLKPRADMPLREAFPDPSGLLRVRSRPGSRFSYSNMGFTLLGMAIESVTEERYESYLDRELLEPLGMHHSTFEFTTQEGNDTDPGLAWGHLDDGSRYPAAAVFLRPAAQFTTTAPDLGRLIRFLLGDGRLAGREFIDEKLMRSRGLARGTEAARAGLVAGYALGLGRRDRNGVIGKCHSGNIVGFVAMLCIFPEHGSGFAYSVNTDSETADYGRIESAIVDSMNLEPATVPDSGKFNGSLQEWHGHYVLAPNRFEMFRYLDTVFGGIKLTAGESGLVMTGLQQSPRQLRPVGDTLFSADDRATASHVLVQSTGGGRLLSDGFRTYARVPAALIFAGWISAAAGILGAAWFLLSGPVLLLRNGNRGNGKVVMPVFLALLTPLAPVLLFLLQPFMALGDFTPASALLAAASLLIPCGAALTVWRILIKQPRNALDIAHGFAAIAVLQWFIVMAFHGLVPLRLWS